MNDEGPLAAVPGHGLRVCDWMSKPPVVVSREATVADARGLLRTHRIRHLPVVAGGRCLGMVSERTLRLAGSGARATSAGDFLRPLGDCRVSDVLGADLVAVAPDETLGRAAETMRAHRVGGLPVLDGGQLVGVITETDVFRALVELLGLERPGVRMVLPSASGDLPLWEQLRGIEERGLVLASLLAFTAPDDAQRRTVVRAVSPGAS